MKNTESDNSNAKGANGEKNVMPEGEQPINTNKNNLDKAQAELSEEDKRLIETLDMLIERLQDSDASLHKPALEALRNQIRSSAVSLTSVPKALKFLRHKYQALVNIYQGIPNNDDKKFLADIISVVAMTQGETVATDATDEKKTLTKGKRETLKYRLLGQKGDIGHWGHEYVRHLAMELMEEFNEEDESTLLPLAIEIANFCLEHNAEPDACDLFYEIGKLPLLVDLCTKEGRDHERVCLYLQSCVPFEADGDDRNALMVVHQIYQRVSDYTHAVIIALRLGNREMVKDNFLACVDPLLRKQLAFILARQNYRLEDEVFTHFSPKEAEQLQNIINYTNLTDNFRILGRELDILEPKTPDDIYKSHLQDSLRVALAPSPKQNLAATFINGFVNAGFGSDKLLTSSEIEADESKSWIYRVKDHGVLSTVASLGLLHLWDADAGLARLDRYLYSENVYIKAGAVLGIGLVHVGIKNESDPALALLREYLENDGTGEASNSQQKNPSVAGTTVSSPKGGNPLLLKESALLGLALAYAGSARYDVVEPILPLISHENLAIATMAALAVGHVFIGTCNGDFASAILQTLMEREGEQLDKPQARFFILALALLYLGRTEAEAQVVIETLQAIEHRLAKDAQVLVKICSYAGSGNVLKIQELLHLCIKVDQPQKNNKKDETEEQEKEKEKKSEEKEEDGEDEGQAYAVVGISLICMMEDIGKEMSHRLFTHLMHYGSAAVRKAVPLALGLLYASHPAPQVLDLLSKWSHDADKSVAVAAVFAMGLTAAGTNNAKVAQMLRQLAAYYQRDADCLYIVRIAQGLVHAAKGTVSLSPVHSNRLLLSPVGVAGMLTTIVAALDAQNLLLDHSSYLLYFLVPAMYPRFLVTLTDDAADGSVTTNGEEKKEEGELKPKPILVRVGQAVDVVGQAGKPKTITGFQTHMTPVLIAYGERAELATEEYISLSPVLENFVIIKKNPNWTE